MVVYFWSGLTSMCPRVSNQSQAIDNGSKCSITMWSSPGYVKVKNRPCYFHMPDTRTRISVSLLVASILDWSLPEMYPERAFILSWKRFMAGRNYRVYTQSQVLGGPTVCEEHHGRTHCDSAVHLMSSCLEGKSGTVANNFGAGREDTSMGDLRREPASTWQEELAGAGLPQSTVGLGTVWVEEMGEFNEKIYLEKVGWFGWELSEVLL